jgi:hypothetical protein
MLRTLKPEVTLKLVCTVLTLCAFFQIHHVSAQTEPSNLLGAWHLRLWVTGPAPESAGPRRASGLIELRREDMPPGAGAGHGVYRVTYDTTLHSMLGAPQAGPAQAALTAGDSVQLVFNPFIDHGAFRLTGLVRRDSIVGEWHRTSFADDGYRGEFTLIRRR